MITRQYHFNWFSYFRCSNSDEEAIELMLRSGCKGVFLGIESGSPDILQRMNKAASVEKYENGIRLLRRYGITTFASFIVGFPGDTAKTIQETVDFIRHNRPDFYRAQLWYCEPGTPIQRERAKYQLTGQGFNWSHATMTSKQAIEHVETIVLNIAESVWLPQWSFDFWILPYLLGKGISIDQTRRFTSLANELLKSEIAHHVDTPNDLHTREYLNQIVECVRSWTKP